MPVLCVCFFVTAEQVEDRRLKKEERAGVMKSLWCGITYYRPTDRRTNGTEQNKPEWRKWGVSQHWDTNPQTPVENRTRREAPNTPPWERLRHPSFFFSSLLFLPFVYLSCEHVGRQCQPFWTDSTGRQDAAGFKEPKHEPDQLQKSITFTPSALEKSKSIFSNERQSLFVILKSFILSPLCTIVHMLASVPSLHLFLWLSVTLTI